MATDTLTPTTTTPTLRPGDDLVTWARTVGPDLALAAEAHDRDGSWVADSFERLRSAGYLTAAVPVELGGLGATIGDLARAQRELARHCASTALASSMHQHVTAFTAWRFRRDMPGAEATLRRVVDDGIVLVSSGGGDFTHPRGEAVRVDGGFRVSGRKPFASQAPVGSVVSTMFAYDDPEQGMRVINTAVPLSDPGVTVDETWDALGMRGTGSHDLVIDDVFIPDEKVMANRPHGVLDPPLQVILSIAMPIISGVYLGVAESARDHAVAIAGHRDDPSIQRRVGLMDTRLRVAGWALDGALDVVGDDPAPSMETVAAVLAAKREVALAGQEVCDLAMSVAGGRAFAKGSPIERAYRDVRGAAFHPLDPEQSLLHAGRLALGEPCDEW
jgi:alkylation response protein AidB-like acyl-CoA dehydrogenase